MSNIVERKLNELSNWKILSKVEKKIFGEYKVEKPEGVQEFDGYYLPEKRDFSKLELFIAKILQDMRMRRLSKEIKKEMEKQ